MTKSFSIRDRQASRAWIEEATGPIETAGPCLRASDVARLVGLPTVTIVAHLRFGCGLSWRYMPSDDPLLDSDLASVLVTYWSAPPIDAPVLATELVQ